MQLTSWTDSFRKRPFGHHRRRNRWSRSPGAAVASAVERLEDRTLLTLLLTFDGSSGSPVDLSQSVAAADSVTITDVADVITIDLGVANFDAASSPANLLLAYNGASPATSTSATIDLSGALDTIDTFSVDLGAEGADTISVQLDAGAKVGGDVTVVATAGTATLNAIDVGAALDVTAASSVLTADITTAGGQSYNSTVTIDGTLTLTGSEVDFLDGSDSVVPNAPSDTLTFLPSNPAATITVGSLVDSGATILDLTDTDIDALSNGFLSITIGDVLSGSGPVAIDSATFDSPLTIAGGEITVTELTGTAVDVTLLARTGHIRDGGDGGTDISGAAISLTTLDATLGEIGASGDELSLAADSLLTDSSASNSDQFLSEVDTLSVTSVDAGSATLHILAGDFSLNAADVINDATGINLADVAGAVLALNGNDEIFAGLAGGGTTGGHVTLGAQTLTVVDASNTTFSGILSGGGGSLLKQGVGTLTLTGANTYSGGTTISDGSLLVNNSSGSGTGTGPVVVTGGGILGGTGSIDGLLTVQAGSTLAPGSSPGILATGDLNLATGATLDIEIEGTTVGTEYDQVDVTGTVDLDSDDSGGATLNVTFPAAFTAAPGDSFTIINNDGVDPVSDTFSGLAEGDTVLADGIPLEISYAGGDGNDVVLTFDTEPVIKLDGIDNTLNLALDAGGTLLQFTTDSGMLLDVPLLDLTSLDIDGGDDDDTLTVDFSNGSPIPGSGLFFHGGETAETNGDALVLVGYVAGNLEVTHTGAEAGNVVLDGGPLIDFSQIEPLTLGGTAANLVIDLTSTGVTNPDVVLSDDGGASDPDATQDPGASALDGSTFEFTQFNNPTNSLTILLGPNSDTLQLDTLDAAFDADVTLTGGAAADTLRVATAFDTGSGEQLVVSAVESIDVNAQLSADAGITLSGPTTTNLGGNLQTDGGNVTINAGAIVIDAALVTIDTETSGGSDGGNVDLTGVTSISADAAARDLTIDTGSTVAAGNGGNVTLVTLGSGGGANIDDLQITCDSSTDGTINLSGDVVTTGNISLNNVAGVVLITADTELDGDNVDVESGVSGTFTLTLDGATSVDVAGTITTTNLTTQTAATVDAINIDGDLNTGVGTLTVDNGDAIVATNATTGGAVNVTAGLFRVVADASLGGHVTASGNIDLDDADGVLLTADTELDGDNVDVESGVSGVLTTLTLDGATSVDVAGTVTTTNLTTQTAATVDAINIAGDLNTGVGTLTVDNGDAIVTANATTAGAVNVTAGLFRVVADASLGGNVNATGTITFVGDVTLTASLTITTADTLTHNARTDGAFDLTLAGTGDAVFVGPVGGLTELGDGVGAALAVNMTGVAGTVFQQTLQTNSGITQDNAAGIVQFDDDVTTAAGSVGSALDSHVVLDGMTWSAAGAVTLGSAAADSLTVSTAATAVLVTGADTTVHSTTTLNADLTLQGDNITLNAAVDGNSGLLLNSAGTTQINADIGGAIAVASLTTDDAGGGAEQTRLAGDVSAQGASMTFNDPLILEQDVTLKETGSGDIRFNNTVDTAAGLAAGEGDLALDVLGGGQTFFGDGVGSDHIGSGVSSGYSGLGSGAAGEPALQVLAGDVTFSGTAGQTASLRGDMKIEGASAIGSAGTASLATIAYVDPDATGKPSPVVTVAASDVTIENLVLRDGAGGAGAGIQFDDTAGRHNVAIDHVEVLNNAQAGIQVGATGSAAADRHQFTNITNSHIHDNQAVGGIVLGNAANADIRGNVVLHNAGDGVLVQQRASDTNSNIRVRENNIWGNSGLAIDLESAGQDAVFGVTFNDKSDATNSDSDTGANNLQNTPEILYAFVTRDGGGQLDELNIIYHVPSATTHAQYGMNVAFYLSDFFGDLGNVPNAPATGAGGFSNVAPADLDGREAATFLSTDFYTVDEALSTRTATIPAATLGAAAAAVLNQAAVANFVTPVRIVATATDLSNNTSEFSRAAVINPQPGQDPQSQAPPPPDGPPAFGPSLGFIDELSATGFLFTPGPVAPLASEVPALRFDWTTEGDHAHNPAYPWAILDNEFGFFKVDDAAGTVGGLAPSFNSNYAQNAFSAHTILRNSDKSDALDADLSQTGIVQTFNVHDRLAWYLVSNTSSQVLVGPTGEHPTGAGGAPIGNAQPNPLNSRPGLFDDTAVAFFSYLAANPDALNHMRTKLRTADDEVNSLFQLTGDPGTDGVFDNGDFTGEIQFFWEQSLDLGDFAVGIRDGEDAVITAVDPFVEPISSALSKEPPASSAASLALSLDESLGLHTTGNLFFNWGGLNEKWVQDADAQWYYILPDGKFFRWNGSPSSALSGTLLATLDAGYHADPVTLYAAYDAPQAQALDTNLNLKTTGNLHLNWGGLNEKWIRDDATSQWYYITPDGSLFAWSGGSTSVGTLVSTLGAEYYTDPSLLYYSQSYSVIKPLGLESTGNLHENWGGLNEKWLRNLTTLQWYFITPDGNVFAWDGSPSSALTGLLVGNVSSTFQAELTVPFMSAFLAKFSRWDSVWGF